MLILSALATVAPVLHAVGTVVSPSHVLWGDGTATLAAPATSVIAAAPSIPDFSLVGLAAIAGAIFGPAFMTIVPYLVRCYAGLVKFDPTYLLTTLRSAAVGVIGGSVVVPTIPPNASALGVFILSFLATSGLHAILSHTDKIPGAIAQSSGKAAPTPSPNPDVRLVSLDGASHFAPMTGFSESEQTSEPIQVPLTPAQVQAQAKPIAPPAKPGVKPRPTIDLKDNNS